MNEDNLLDLDTLSDGIPVIIPEAAGYYKTKCMVCLNKKGHSTGTKLIVNRFKKVVNCKISWSGSVTDQMINAYKDQNKLVDDAACALALLLVRELTQYKAIEQSNIGTTIDYYLSEKQDDFLIFNRSARLEVSGILEENKSNTVDARIKQKVKRLKEENGMQTIITIVEFGNPRAKMVAI